MYYIYIYVVGFIYNTEGKDAIFHFVGKGGTRPVIINDGRLKGQGIETLDGGGEIAPIPFICHWCSFRVGSREGGGGAEAFPVYYIYVFTYIYIYI